MSGARIIVVDGPDYSGKSTLVQKIKAEAEAAGYNVVTMGFPRNDNPHGHQARLLIGSMSSNKKELIKCLTNDFLDGLREASELDDSHVVIFDRFYISACVYQGHAAYLQQLDAKVYDLDTVPNEYVVCKVPYQVALERHQKRMEENGVDWDSEFTLKGVLRDCSSWLLTQHDFEYYMEKLKRRLPSTKFTLVENICSETTAKELALFA